jgi:succinate-semialdehyde dehydrogenase / glutarate-semialdehyde dehydrogenase
MKIQSINPSTESVNKEFELFSKEQAFEICKSSNKAFQSWKTLPLNERTKLIRALGVTLRSNKEKYARLITLEMGKPLKEAIAEVEKCALTCDVYADNAQKWLEDEPIATEAKKSFISIEPTGTILAIMPWNFPFWQALRCAIPALTVGNVSVLRHSNSVPMCALAIEEAFKESGFSENVFRTIITDYATVNKLIKSRYIQGVSLTGSSAAGKEIAKIAGKSAKKVVLELGGSDPFIVLEDADIEHTALKAKEGRNLSSGQSCIAAKRFIVVKSVADEFTKQLISITKEVVVGDPMDIKTEIGPLANKSQLEKLDSQVKDAISKGAKVECGGKRHGSKGYFYEPTVLTNIKNNMLVAHDEVFGPVSPIIIAKNEKDAIKIANSTTFGLGASIWTSDIEKGERLARQIEAGMVYVNQIVRSDPRLPFGGVKESGVGRELSRYGLLEFANIKSIVIA